MALTKVGKEGITGIDNSSDATAITIDSSENLGIGETSPLGKLHIKSGDSGASSVNANANELVIENSDYTGITILGENESNICFGDNEDPDVGRIEYHHSDNAMKFRTNASDKMTIASTGAVTIANGLTLTDGNLVVANGHGIDFSATADGSGSMGSELFENYEIGSWTPTDASGASLSFSTVTAPTYTRIGRMVYLATEVTYPTTSNTAQARIGGLPFAVASGTAFGAFVRYSNSGETTPFIIANPGQSDVILYANNGGTFSNALLSGHRFDFVAVYQTT